MRLAALSLVAILCGISLAAPAPFLESRSPEAVLETGSKQRTEALLRWLKAADLAQAVLPGQSALPAPFASRLKATQKDGFRVVIKLQGGARTEDRALFNKLIGKVTARPTVANAEMAARMRAEQMERAMIVQKLVVIRGRGGRIAADGAYLERLKQQIADQEIRANPPKLVVGPSR
jgi:hypothetical protein